VEDKGDGIPRSGNWTLRGKNIKEKGGWSPKLASAKKHKGSAKVSRTCKLLQKIH